MTTPTTVVLTGATSGIGLAAARVLARQPASLIIHGPQPEEAVSGQLTELRAARGNTSDAPIHYVVADFTRDDAVTVLAERMRDLTDRVDLLINNAAIPGPEHRRTGAWGAEVTFGVNYLAGALLTELVIPLIPTDGKIINVASATHETATLDLDDLSFEHRRYSPVAAYAQSKLAIVTNSARLSDLIPQTVLSVHPGVVSTGLLHAMFGSGGSPVTEGARNLLAATTARVPSGSYLHERTPSRPNPAALDADIQHRLHRVTQELLGRTIR